MSSEALVTESNPSQYSLEQSPEVGSKQMDKQMLAEARQTRELLVAFDAAIQKGTFEGHSMLAIARGLAFLNVLLDQNKGHIKTLQDRVGE